MKQRWSRTQSKFGAGLFGNDALGKKGINNSMTAKMGTLVCAFEAIRKGKEPAVGEIKNYLYPKSCHLERELHG
jgi:hypothetical protein